MAAEPFEIGLVGAGAISAGAYTAGVIDFMVYALDLWYQAKADGDPAAPQHDVKLSVFSGASAGAITAALAAGYLASDQPPMTSENRADYNNGRNKLYDSWVDRIDMSSLLQGSDLADSTANVVSALDSTVLSEIAQTGLDVEPRAHRRPYVAEDFELLLTVTNLRGVPYGFTVDSGWGGIDKYDMSLHADYVHFQINDTGPDPDISDRYTLSWTNLCDAHHPVTQKLKTAALASGAFPIGLAPRTLEHAVNLPGGNGMYSSRRWSVPTPDEDACVRMECIKADWGNVQPSYNYSFQCVDGGVMNNEPLELARRLLAGKNNYNPRQCDSASRAVIMIDPFPSESLFDPDYSEAPDLVSMAKDLFNALKNQARFKPDELTLASSTGTCSRFMIAPRREGELYPIACGSLGGFGGFLSKKFRRHDYFLGRRNAQRFFREYFVLPADHPLFESWSADAVNAYEFEDQNGDRVRPIIPMLGEAMDECVLLDWPRYEQTEFSTFREQVNYRAGLVINRMVEQYFSRNWLITRFIAKKVLARKKRDLVQYVEKVVSTDLRKMLLIRD